MTNHCVKGGKTVYENMELEETMDIQNEMVNKKMVLAVLAFVLLMFLAWLGQRHLWNADEPRVAGIAAHISNTGEFAVPRLNGKAFLEKPPLYFWITAVTFNLLGQNNFAARFPSALSAIGGVLVVYLLARKIRFSILAACLSVLICATSFEYWSIGRRCIIDMMLAFFITATMTCFYLAITSKKYGLLLGHWLYDIVGTGGSDQRTRRIGDSCFGNSFLADSGEGFLTAFMGTVYRRIGSLFYPNCPVGFGALR
jgi:hypothetical protein